MAWLLNLLNFYHFNHVRYSIENESIFCIKNLFYIIFVEEKITFVEYIWFMFLSICELFHATWQLMVDCYQFLLSQLRI